MFSKIDPHNDGGAENPDKSRLLRALSRDTGLLREIEELSKGLYLHKTPPKPLLSPSRVRFQSAQKILSSEPKSKLTPEFLIEDEPDIEGKSSSKWNWKKHFRALTNFRHQKKFNCLFSLHVHSIEGLPSHFDGFSLCVYWKRKGEILWTRPSRVFQGVSEIDETLIHRCSVYGGRNGTNHLAHYDPKLFSIQVSVIEVPGLNNGKHWVDLTRILPPTLEELEGDKSSGKWTTSFKLSGKAKGARLNVSFGFMVIRDDLAKYRSHMNVPGVLNLLHNRSSIDENAADSLNYGSMISCRSLDLKIGSEFLNPRLELLKSMNFLYQKLDEGVLGSSQKSNFALDEQLELKSNVELEFDKEIDREEYDSTEFVVVECGVEVNWDQFELDKGAAQTMDGSEVETIYFDEIIEDDVTFEKKMNHNSKNRICDNHGDECTVDDCKYDENIEDIKESTIEELDLGKLLEQENHTEVKASYKGSKIVQKSLSFDEVAESVATDFLNMIGMEHGSFQFSDCDPESPRDSFFKQLENQALVSSDSIFYYDAREKCPDFDSADIFESGSDDHDDNFDLSSITQAAEEECIRSSHLRSRRAKILEDLETKVLMQEWGLSEKNFQCSPCDVSSGFGSPIEILPEDKPKLPPIAEGPGSFAEMKGGGFLRSMNPLVFCNARNGEKLIVQGSRPVVLPVEMGYGIMEILENLASLGTEKLSVLANRLMPMDGITGKTIQRLARDDAPSRLASDSEGHQLREAEGFPSGWNFINHGSELEGYKMSQYFISLHKLVLFVIDETEVLLIEGLKIQSGMSSDQETPLHINTHFFHKTSAFGDNRSLDLFVTLDEWLSLDARIMVNEDQDHEDILRVLKSHHLKCANSVGSITRQENWGEEQGLMGNNLTLALMVQLRDPLRNDEPVGVPMLFLIQAEIDVHSTIFVKTDKEEDKEAVSIHSISNEKNDEKINRVNGGEEDHVFKISSVHLLGINSESDKKEIWGRPMQRQSGTRWLLASGIGKSIKVPSIKSKETVKSSSIVEKVHPGNILWSISSHVHGKENVPKELGRQIPYTRNPDFILMDSTLNSICLAVKAKA